MHTLLDKDFENAAECHLGVFAVTHVEVGNADFVWCFCNQAALEGCERWFSWKGFE